MPFQNKAKNKGLLNKNYKIYKNFKYIQRNSEIIKNLNNYENIFKANITTGDFWIYVEILEICGDFWRFVEICGYLRRYFEIFG